MKHHILAGRTPDGRVFVTIQWDGKRLSMTGVVGPTPNGNCRGSCGQILETLRARDFEPAPGVDAAKLYAVWNGWHLNDMQAGSPAQMEWLRAHPETPTDYMARCDALSAAGLNPDPADGYKYGTRWLHRDVPADVIEWLAALPTSDGLPTVWQQ